MKTVLVKYKVWVTDLSNEGNHRFMDRSQIVDVLDLKDLNEMFKNITDVKIL